MFVDVESVEGFDEAGAVIDFGGVVLVGELVGKVEVGDADVVASGGDVGVEVLDGGLEGLSFRRGLGFSLSFGGGLAFLAASLAFSSSWTVVTDIFGVGAVSAWAGEMREEERAIKRSETIRTKGSLRFLGILDI